MAEHPSPLASDAALQLQNSLGDCSGRLPSDMSLLEVRKSAAVFANLLAAPSGEQVLKETCLGLCQLFGDGIQNERIQAILDAAVVPRLVALLQTAVAAPSYAPQLPTSQGHGASGATWPEDAGSGAVPMPVSVPFSAVPPAVQSAALQVIGNIACGDDRQTQVIIDCAALPCLRELLSSHERGIRKECCWIVSNITESAHQVKDVLDAGILPPLLRLVECQDTACREDATWGLYNITANRDSGQIATLAELGGVRALCGLLHCTKELDVLWKGCSTVAAVALKGIRNILAVGEADAASVTAADLAANRRGAASALNRMAAYVADAHGVERIEALMTHGSPDVRTRARGILQGFFGTEPQPLADAGPLGEAGSHSHLESSGRAHHHHHHHHHHHQHSPGGGGGGRSVAGLARTTQRMRISDSPKTGECGGSAPPPSESSSSSGSSASEPGDMRLGSASPLEADAAAVCTGCSDCDGRLERAADMRVPGSSGLDEEDEDDDDDDEEEEEEDSDGDLIPLPPPSCHCVLCTEDRPLRDGRPPARRARRPSSSTTGSSVAATRASEQRFAGGYPVDPVLGAADASTHTSAEGRSNVRGAGAIPFLAPGSDHSRLGRPAAPPPPPSDPPCDYCGGGGHLGDSRAALAAKLGRAVRLGHAHCLAVLLEAMTWSQRGAAIEAPALLHPGAAAMPPPPASASTSDASRAIASAGMAQATADAAAPSSLPAVVLAAQLGKVSCLRLLVARCRPELDATYGRKRLTPLAWAAHKGYLGCCQALLMEGASAAARCADGVTALHLAASSGGHVALVRLLLTHHAPVRAQSAKKQTPLCLAAQKGYVRIVRLLLQHGADPNNEDDGKYTPLHLAASNGHEECAESLIGAGANVDASTSSGVTPIHYAVQGRHARVVQLLVQAGAEVNCFRNPLLLIAADDGSAEVVRVLLDANAPTDCRANIKVMINKDADVEDTLTPLHLAASKGHTEVVELLLAHGADVNSRTAKLWTALDFAVLNAHPSCAHALLDHGAYVDPKSKLSARGGGTLVTHAAGHGNRDIVRRLVERIRQQDEASKSQTLAAFPTGPAPGGGGEPSRGHAARSDGMSTSSARMAAPDGATSVPIGASGVDPGGPGAALAYQTFPTSAAEGGARWAGPAAPAPPAGEAAAAYTSPAVMGCAADPLHGPMRSALYAPGQYVGFDLGIDSITMGAMTPAQLEHLQLQQHHQVQFQQLQQQQQRLRQDAGASEHDSTMLPPLLPYSGAASPMYAAPTLSGGPALETAAFAVQPPYYDASSQYMSAALSSFAMPAPGSATFQDDVNVRLSLAIDVARAFPPPPPSPLIGGSSSVQSLTMNPMVPGSMSDTRGVLFPRATGISLAIDPVRMSAALQQHLAVTPPVSATDVLLQIPLPHLEDAGSFPFVSASVTLLAHETAGGGSEDLASVSDDFLPQSPDAEPEHPVSTNVHYATTSMPLVPPVPAVWTPDLDQSLLPSTPSVEGSLSDNGLRPPDAAAYACGPDGSSMLRDDGVNDGASVSGSSVGGAPRSTTRRRGQSKDEREGSARVREQRRRESEAFDARERLDDAISSRSPAALTEAIAHANKLVVQLAAGSSASAAAPASARAAAAESRLLADADTARTVLAQVTAEERRAKETKAAAAAASRRESARRLLSEAVSAALAGGEPRALVRAINRTRRSSATLGALDDDIAAAQAASTALAGAEEALSKLTAACTDAGLDELRAAMSHAQAAMDTCRQLGAEDAAIVRICNSSDAASSGASSSQKSGTKTFEQRLAEAEQRVDVLATARLVEAQGLAEAEDAELQAVKTLEEAAARYESTDTSGASGVSDGSQSRGADKPLSTLATLESAMENAERLARPGDAGAKARRRIEAARRTFTKGVKAARKRLRQAQSRAVGPADLPSLETALSSARSLHVAALSEDIAAAASRADQLREQSAMVTELAAARDANDVSRLLAVRGRLNDLGLFHEAEIARSHADAVAKEIHTRDLMTAASEDAQRVLDAWRAACVEGDGAGAGGSASADASADGAGGTLQAGSDAAQHATDVPLSALTPTPAALSAWSWPDGEKLVKLVRKASQFDDRLMELAQRLRLQAGELAVIGRAVLSSSAVHVDAPSLAAAISSYRRSFLTSSPASVSGATSPLSAGKQKVSVDALAESVVDRKNRRKKRAKGGTAPSLGDMGKGGSETVADPSDAGALLPAVFLEEMDAAASEAALAAATADLERLQVAEQQLVLDEVEAAKESAAALIRPRRSPGTGSGRRSVTGSLHSASGHSGADDGARGTGKTYATSSESSRKGHTAGVVSPARPGRPGAGSGGDAAASVHGPGSSPSTKGSVANKVVALPLADRKPMAGGGHGASGLPAGPSSLPPSSLPLSASKKRSAFHVLQPPGIKPPPVSSSSPVPPAFRPAVVSGSPVPPSVPPTFPLPALAGRPLAPPSRTAALSLSATPYVPPSPTTRPRSAPAPPFVSTPAPQAPPLVHQRQHFHPHHRQHALAAAMATRTAAVAAFNQRHPSQQTSQLSQPIIPLPPPSHPPPPPPPPPQQQQQQQQQVNGRAFPPLSGTSFSTSSGIVSGLPGLSVGSTPGFFGGQMGMPLIPSVPPPGSAPGMRSVRPLHQSLSMGELSGRGEVGHPTVDRALVEASSSFVSLLPGCDHYFLAFGDGAMLRCVHCHSLLEATSVDLLHRVQRRSAQGFPTPSSLAGDLPATSATPPLFGGRGGSSSGSGLPSSLVPPLQPGGLGSHPNGGVRGSGLKAPRNSSFGNITAAASAGVGGASTGGAGSSGFSRFMGGGGGGGGRWTASPEAVGGSSGASSPTFSPSRLPSSGAGTQSPGLSASSPAYGSMATPLSNRFGGSGSSTVGGASTGSGSAVGVIGDAPDDGSHAVGLAHAREAASRASSSLLLSAAARGREFHPAKPLPPPLPPRSPHSSSASALQLPPLQQPHHHLGHGGGHASLGGPSSSLSRPPLGAPHRRTMSDARPPGIGGAFGASLTAAAMAQREEPRGPAVERRPPPTDLGSDFAQEDFGFDIDSILNDPADMASPAAGRGDPSSSGRRTG